MPPSVPSSHSPPPPASPPALSTAVLAAWPGSATSSAQAEPSSRLGWQELQDTESLPSSSSSASEEEGSSLSDSDGHDDERNRSGAGAGAATAAANPSVGRKRRRPVAAAAAPRRERDNWESDCFSELVASGYTVSDLIDARVGSSRVVGGDTAPLEHLFPARESTLYLVHVLVLAAWVEAKFQHATEVAHKLQLRLPTTGAGSSAVLGIHEHRGGDTGVSSSSESPTRAPFAVPPEVIHGPPMILASSADMTGVSSTSAGLHPQLAPTPVLSAAWSKIQHDLQMKHSSTLVYVLTIGQRMAHAQQAWRSAAARCVPALSDGETDRTQSNGVQWDCAPLGAAAAGAMSSEARMTPPRSAAGASRLGPTPSSSITAEAVRHAAEAATASELAGEGRMPDHPCVSSSSNASMRRAHLPRRIVPTPID